MENEFARDQRMHDAEMTAERDEAIRRFDTGVRSLPGTACPECGRQLHARLLDGVWLINCPDWHGQEVVEIQWLT